MGSIAQQGVPPEIQMDREGDGRYAVFAKPVTGGRVRLGTVLGGGRTWSAEPSWGGASIVSFSKMTAGVELLQAAIKVGKL